MKPTIAVVRSELRKMDPRLEVGCDTWNKSLALLSSAIVGPSVDRITRFTGLPRSLVAGVSVMARKNRIWVGSTLKVDWFEEDSGGIAFWADVCCIEGLMERGAAKK